jgi:N-acetylglucosamine-6-phosphate deacetylase
MKLFGRHYESGDPMSIEIAQGKISRLTPFPAGEDNVPHWPWIAPGLFDIQVNGYGGQEFSSADITPENVSEIIRTYDAFGVTKSCPTLFTSSFEVLRHSLKTIVAARDLSPDVARRIAGIHVEGPYLSKDDGPRGAHPLEHCRPPDWDEYQRLQEAADGRIRILTMSVEFDTSPGFIKRVVAGGVVVAIGHTSADPAHIRAAVDAGARLSTHLGNGCHLVLPVHANYFWDQLAEDRLATSLIVDGRHLPAAVVKTFVRVKTPQRCILISDMSGWSGRPPGRYKAGHGELEILPDGSLVVAGQRQLLAGASRPIGAGVANVMRFAGVSLGEAIRMATVNPARLLSMEPRRLAPGEPADLVFFDIAEPEHEGDLPKFAVRSTVAGGEVVWGTPWQP